MTLTAVILLIVILLGTYGIFRILRPSEPTLQNKLRRIPNKPTRNKTQKIRPNRYQRKAPSRAKSLGTNPLQFSKKVEDADAVFGLAEKAPTGHVSASRTTNEQALVDFPDVTLLHLACATDRPYTGYELLQALLSAGLRHGKMGIFHRHESKTGRGPILFSLASMTAPGMFDLPKMGATSCQGLTLFVELKKVNDSMVAYELMLDTASQLVEDLGGIVLDETRQPMTKDKLVQQRQLIRQLEQAKRTQDLFANVEN